MCLLGLLLLTACASHPTPIQHVVFIQLKDAQDTKFLLKDAESRLAPIPGIKSYVGGQHLEIGRANIERQYSAAFIFGFDSVEAYEGYLDHPAHVDFVDRWRSRVQWFRIYDIAP